MYTARNVLKLWGKTDPVGQRRLKLKYFSGLSERKFEDDFVGFLAREFKLESDALLSNKGSSEMK